MKKLSLLIWACCLTLAINAQKVNDVKEVKEMDTKDVKDGWTSGGGIGLDFSALSLINPRIGAGSNQTKWGGALNYFAKYKKGSFIWDSRAEWLMSVINSQGQPSTKAADALHLTTTIGYKVGSSGKWYLGVLGDLQTQILSTYGLNYLDQNVNIGGVNTPQTLSSSLFSPAVFKLSPGLIYKYDPHLTFFFSPVAVKGIIVADNALASQVADSSQHLGRLGNNWRSATNFDNITLELGVELRADYSNKFFNDKIIYSGSLDLYSNYLRNPQNIAIEFYNSFDYLISKHFFLNFKTDWFYDDRQLVQIGGDPKNLGKNVFIRNFLLLKYGATF